MYRDIDNENLKEEMAYKINKGIFSESDIVDFLQKLTWAHRCKVERLLKDLPLKNNKNK